ncbi:hypothetical protein PI124_g20621 [Phytophthora idaei]|nr:hypothetical protein PI125_g22047 [Phytophthora idaei]KAG3130774.1 hypothetical protein PI126_g20354 [Phytophthora idaei]KAG3234321.1 hypothetical protein PI124_g20621 [Phytophthora idaei]
MSSMRLSYVLLLAAAALVMTLDATSGATRFQSSTANTANAHESIGTDHRFLRMQKEDKVDDENEHAEEEIMVSFSAIKDKAKAVLTAARLSAATSTDDMASIIAKVSEKGEVNVLFAQIEPRLIAVLPDFNRGMDLNAFDKLIRSSSKITSDQADVLIVAYAKYLAINNLIRR